MASIIILVIVAAIFWILALFSKRRFGVLGLALASGALLSSLWSNRMVGIIENTDISFASISIAGLVSTVIVLAPAALLLFSGPSYTKKHGRMAGAILFAVFATALIAGPLSSTLILDTMGRSIFQTISNLQPYIVTIGIIIALLDMLAVHTVNSLTPKGKH